MIEIHISLIPNYPPLPVGVAITRRDGKYGLLLRKGQTKAQRRRAILVGKMLLWHFYGIAEHEAKTEVAA